MLLKKQDFFSNTLGHCVICIVLSCEDSYFAVDSDNGGCIVVSSQQNASNAGYLYFKLDKGFWY